MQAAGHTVRVFSRIAAAFIEERGVISWDPYSGRLPERYLEGCDTVINLCGVSIANSRWTPDYRHQIVDSRVVTTDLIARKIAGMESPPPRFLNASAVGFYGHRDIGQQLTESSPTGSGFLAEMCRQWEAATSIAEWAGIRVVHMRFGVVVGAGGGLLARIAPLFRMNLGAQFGHGQQPMSWVAMPDLVRAVEVLIESPSLSKAVNVTSPVPVTNQEFTEELAAALGTRAFLRIPAWALLLTYGDMAREALLGGQAVVPKKLNEIGFKFQCPKLREALGRALT